MKTGKKIWSLLLALVMIVSLMGGMLTVNAEGDPFTKAEALEAGYEYLIVTEAGGKYYALTCNGANTGIGATEVAVEGDSVAEAPAGAIWKTDGADHLENLGTPGQCVFGSSGGLFTWDKSNLRTFAYDAASQTVTLHNGRYC